MFGSIRACLSKEKELYKAVENILGFYPGNIFLYRLAFRHKSASEVVGSMKSNNERLEYLGDSVISTAVAHYLFKRYPNKDEGFLTEMRSKMVSRATLNKVALKMGLHELLHIDAKSGGFKSADGNALEALMGAVFLDKGYRFTEKVIIRRIIAVHIDMEEIEKRDWNYKSKLIDWGQKSRFRVNFQVVGTMQQKGKKLYKVAAMVNTEVWGEGIDQSIKAAEQIASENAYKNKVLSYIEKQEKKGYREPVPDDFVLNRPQQPVSPQVSKPAPVSDMGAFTISGNLGLLGHGNSFGETGSGSGDKSVKNPGGKPVPLSSATNPQPLRSESRERQSDSEQLPNRPEERAGVPGKTERREKPLPLALPEKEEPNLIPIRSADSRERNSEKKRMNGAESESVESGSALSSLSSATEAASSGKAKGKAVSDTRPVSETGTPRKKEVSVKPESGNGIEENASRLAESAVAISATAGSPSEESSGKEGSAEEVSVKKPIARRAPRRGRSGEVRPRQEKEDTEA